MSLVVMGIDPGLHSLGIVVLKDGRISHCLQVATSPSKRAKAGDESARWLRIATGAIADARPHVIGIEDFEPQPWKTHGKIPKGAVKLQRLVADMRSSAELTGATVYTQSPSVTDMPMTVLAAAIRGAMGHDYKPLPHLLDALAHAYTAESTFKRARSVDAPNRHGQ